jgi:glucose/arabinose dehydrogenase
MCVVALALLLASAAQAEVLDPAFIDTAWVSSPQLEAATGMAWAPDGSNRLFVITKGGSVLVIKNGALLPAPFATLTPIYTGSECGLIGIAFDPNFLVNQYVYLFVTVSASEQQIVRYTAMGDTGVAKTTIVAGLPTNGANHDGGALGVGPDGKLYWAVGDLGSGMGVQGDLTSLAAKVGRANLDGTLARDNPFADGAGPNNDFIWARGFRNPFTLTFQPATGLLWIEDVGAVYEQIFVVRKGDHAGWTLFEINQPDGYIRPAIKYRTNTVDTLTLTGATRAGGLATLTTTTPHYFELGEKITIAGVTEPTLNGPVFVRGIPTPTSFTAAQAGPDVTGTGGTATTLLIGGCVTGGAFYDATLFPAAYRGNFFFGDYNTGIITRATIDPASNTVTTVDHWARSIGHAVDTAVGPDGALYYVGTTTNAVHRATPRVRPQGLVVSPTNVWMAEGQAALVMVSLARDPGEDVDVSIGRTSGDADLGVLFGSRTTFNSKNWNVPQPVTITAARDLDTADDVAVLSATSRGLPIETVTVHARDENGLALQVSPLSLTIDEGQSAGFMVALTAQPSIDVVVSSTRAGDADVSVSAGGALIFTTANWATPQRVTVAAARDPDGADDVAAIAVAASGVPGATVSVLVRDDGMMAPLITSTPVTTATVGVAYSYQVQATGTPAPRLSLDAPPAGMAIDAAGLISWLPQVAGTFAVGVRATNGVNPDAVQRFTITVAARPVEMAVDAAAPDARPPVDAGADAAKVEAIAPSGCSCRAGGQGASALPLLALLLALSRAVGRRRGRGR